MGHRTEELGEQGRGREAGAAVLPSRWEEVPSAPPLAREPEAGGLSCLPQEAVWCPLALREQPPPGAGAGPHRAGGPAGAGRGPCGGRAAGAACAGGTPATPRAIRRSTLRG